MTRTTNAPLTADVEADVEGFLADHHDEIRVKLAEAQEEIARGEAVPLEPLETLLGDARAHARK